MKPTTVTALMLFVSGSLAGCGQDARFPAHPRLLNGQPANGRNGSVIIRLKKTKEELTDPNKEYWYCSGALVAPRCVVTAAHCIRDNTEWFKDHADVWHPSDTVVWPPGGKNAGRPKPGDGDTPVGIADLARRGADQQDLAVLKLDENLPDPTLGLGESHPDPAKRFVATIYGNGVTEDGTYAHRTLDMTVYGEAADPDAAGWSYLYLYDPDTWDEADHLKRRAAAPGDSGGPVLYDGRVIGVVSRSFSPDAPQNLRRVSVTSVVAPEARQWVLARIDDVCGEGGDTTTGGSSTGSDGSSSTTGTDGTDTDSGDASTSGPVTGYGSTGGYGSTTSATDSGGSPTSNGSTGETASATTAGSTGVWTEPIPDPSQLTTG